MLTLCEVKIFKYKSFLEEQTVKIEDKITTLVGKNESGKTAFLEALAKVNYFEENADFKFNTTSDYPRKELKKFQKNDEDIEVIRCKFKINRDLIKQINTELNCDVFNLEEFSYGINYKKGNTWYNIEADEEAYIKQILSDKKLDPKILLHLEKIKSIKELVTQIDSLDYSSFDIEKIEDEKTKIKKIKTIVDEIISNSHEGEENKLGGYIAEKYLKPNFPKFWYFDDYYSLPSRININHLKTGRLTEDLDKEAMKTSKALFELANIDIEQLLQLENFESFKTELEATSNEITDELFKYWKTNENLEIEFAIDTKNIGSNQHEKILDIRVKNKKHRVTLPLRNRSKGFKWFFSFLVWFKKIQADKKSSYILLLDEPGLNLHASAQNDLLGFIDDLSNKYQIIYTTHSPFMIDSLNLERARTIFDSDRGSIISEALQEKDPDTLFPLQAALGYDIAQNLFISKNNLLVEGPADLLYLTIISSILEQKGRSGLNPKITIVPVGGLDKVVTFISLLRGSKLNIVCLLDTFKGSKGKQRLDSLIKQKIIRDKNIKFFHDYTKTDNNKADIEDMFKKEEYLKLFNQSHNNGSDIKLNNLNSAIPNIINQINTFLNIEPFNHYKPAYYLSQNKDTDSFFSEETLNRFKLMFEDINKLFESVL